MDYNQSIPNIYLDSLASDNTCDIVIEKNDLKKNNAGVCYVYNFTFILIKMKKKCFINGWALYNNYIFFPNHHKNIKYLSTYNPYNDRYDDNCEDNYLEFYKVVVKNFKYRITHYYDNYCTNDDTMTLFFKHKSQYYLGYTIYIDLIKSKTTNIITNKSDLKIIKLQINNFIFYYELLFNNNYNIILYLCSITNITNGNTIKIDIKVTDINKIYQKYEVAFEQIKLFIFDSSNKIFELDIKQLEKQIKGIYYPNILQIEKKL